MTVFIQTGIPSEAMKRTEVMGLPSYDILGIVSAEVFWTMIESTVALIAVCLPAIRKAVAKSTLGRVLGLGTLTRVFRSSKGSSRGTTVGRNSAERVSEQSMCSRCEEKISVGHVLEVSSPV